MDAAQDARRLDSVRFLKTAQLKQDSIHIELILNTLLPEGATDKPIKLEKTIQIQMRRRGCEMRLIVDGISASNKDYDSTLVKSIARAHVWFQELITGSAGSLLELAKQHDVSESYVKKIIPLAFLSPILVKGFLSGKTASFQTKQSLTRRLDIPYSWIEQKLMIASY